MIASSSLFTHRKYPAMYPAVFKDIIRIGLMIGLKKKMQEPCLRLSFQPGQVPSLPGVLRQGGVPEVPRCSPPDEALPAEHPRPCLAQVAHGAQEKGTRSQTGLGVCRDTSRSGFFTVVRAWANVFRDDRALPGGEKPSRGIGHCREMPPFRQRASRLRERFSEISSRQI